MSEKKGIESKSKKQVAYTKIKEMIIEGKVKKDTPLVERQLCDELGISRTPVREALRELAGDGLVEITEGKGVIVKRIEFRDMVEIFEMREALEQMAMKLFIQRADDAAIEAFEEEMKKQEEAYEKDDHEAFMNSDMKLHRLIADNAQNIRLKNAITNIYEQIQMMAISAKDDQKMRDIAIEAHRKMQKAIEEKDTEAAQAAIVEHILEVKKLHMERYYLL